MSPRRADKTITGIERQARRKGRVSILLDGEFAFSIDPETCVRFGLRRGDTLSPERITEILETEEDHRARLAVLRLLRGRLRSEQEIRRKLTDRELPPACVERVIRQFLENGMIDDRRFAEAFLHDMTLRGSAGIRILRKKLQEKGIERETADTVLGTVNRQDQQEKLARASADRYLRRHSRTGADQLPKLRQHLTQYLGRRGFEWPVIAAVIRACPRFRSIPREED